MPTLREEPDYITQALRDGRAVDTTPRPALDPIQAEIDDKAAEKAFQVEVIKFAKRNGWKHFHVYDSRKSVAGWPDLVLVRRGRIIFAELKSATGKTTADQDSWLEELGLVAAGTEHVKVFLWRPNMWSQIVKELT